MTGLAILAATMVLIIAALGFAAWLNDSPLATALDVAAEDEDVALTLVRADETPMWGAGL